MNVDILNRTGLHAASMSKMAIADGDIHPRPAGVGIGGVSKSLYPYLSRRWIDHVEEFGIQYRQPWEKGSAYPKAQPQACRRDAFLPDGRAPGSDLAFMAEQHLDPNNVALGILNPLTSGQGAVNPLLSDAITHATNEWQKAEWTSQDKRLRGSVVVPYEDAAASVKEIELLRSCCCPAPPNRWDNAATGRSMRLRPRPIWRSGSTRSATAAGPTRPAAGAAITLRKWSGTASLSRRC